MIDEITLTLAKAENAIEKGKVQDATTFLKQAAQIGSVIAMYRLIEISPADRGFFVGELQKKANHGNSDAQYYYFLAAEVPAVSNLDPILALAFLNDAASKSHVLLIRHDEVFMQRSAHAGLESIS